MPDKLVEIERRAIADYRLALGLELKARRMAARYTLAELSTRTLIPAETLRGYEHGGSQPQLIRLASIADVFGVSALSILTSTAECIYRANGAPIPTPENVPKDKIVLRAILFYCGVLPSQLAKIEAVPLARPTGTPDIDL
ncbi:helix-turn-helix domain-containing protein [Allokutzneria sp. A3M-2-11 16]|uniref:helix-turn-helix domain-containing protein n=1 Tax=Allokutzneria sp. A3M-2-11 16 TaxID=2962043 RepID=UPI0020B648C4|nr:helix-turn-helix transcriptional regulator [Allokutzneria sp. A3M-2-11 16]MCP3803884.1 helix-turn-helix domain-containing protein [Allokutzneria sp. A3M-2-11 16]